MKYIKNFEEFIINEITYISLDDILINKSFLYKLSKTKLFTEEQSDYINYILNLNVSLFLDKNEISLLFEGFFGNLVDKTKTFGKNIVSSTTDILNTVKDFIKKYVDSILLSLDQSYNVFGDNNDKFNTNTSISIYSKYKENLQYILKGASKDETEWYDKVYNFLMKTFTDLVNTIKSIFKKEVSEEIKESLLIGDFRIILENNDPKMIDDHINIKLSKISLIIKKIDMWINTKFQWLIKLTTNFGNLPLQNFAKIIKSAGGPQPPKKGFKNTISSFMYVMHKRYTDLGSKAGKYLNTTSFVNSIFKKFVKHTAQLAIPGSFVVFKLIDIINIFDVNRKLIKTIEGTPI